MSLQIRVYTINEMVLDDRSWSHNECKLFAEQRCYEDCQWSKVINKCIECEAGFYGINCSTPCRYPNYGKDCQQECSDCGQEKCNSTLGCLSSNVLTSKESRILTAVDKETTVTSVTFLSPNQQCSHLHISENVFIVIGYPELFELASAAQHQL